MPSAGGVELAQLRQQQSEAIRSNQKQSEASELAQLRQQLAQAQQREASGQMQLQQLQQQMQQMQQRQPPPRQQQSPLTPQLFAPPQQQPPRTPSGQPLVTSQPLVADLLGLEGSGAVSGATAEDAELMSAFGMDASRQGLPLPWPSPSSFSLGLLRALSIAS